MSTLTVKIPRDFNSHAPKGAVDGQSSYDEASKKTTTIRVVGAGTTSTLDLNGVSLGAPDQSGIVVGPNRTDIGAIWNVSAAKFMQATTNCGSEDFGNTVVTDVAATNGKLYFHADGTFEDHYFASISS